VHLLLISIGNQDKCPHCNAERKTRLDDENNVKEMMKRVEVNDLSRPTN
jgi:hypothetical protein